MKIFIHIFRIIKAFVKKVIDNIRVAVGGEKLVYKPSDDGVQVVMGDIADKGLYKKDSMKALHRIRVPTT